MNITTVRFLLALVLLALGAGSAAAEPGPLLQGVLGDEIAAVRAALDRGAPVNAIDPAVGSTALHAAVAPGGPRDRSIAELLLTRGARPDQVDPATGLTPLTAATVVTEQGAFASLERVRSANVAEVLLNGGADPNQPLAKGETPLMLAVSQNNLPVVKLLLARGANPNLRDANLSTALHVAYATNRGQEIIDALLAAGANPRLRDAQGLVPGEMPQPAATQNAATDRPATPAPADPAPEKPSSMNKWLVGGAVVATAVIGSVVLAHLVKEQKRKKAQQSGAGTATTAALTSALTTVTGGGQASPTPTPAPQPIPQPVPMPPAPAPAPAPVPPAPTPPPSPTPAPLAGIFDGRYGAQTVLPDGFTHTERANVEGTTVALNHEFVSRDGTTTGSFRWSGVLRMLPGTPPRAEITGQGAINNQGVRNFTLDSATIVITPAGDVQLCWKATDPKFGGIGGCTKRGFAPPPAPGLPVPPPTSPQVTVPVATFDGSYGSRVVSGDGFTHTEQANVLGGKIELTHEFISKDGQTRGSFRWSGVLEVQPGAVPMAKLKGSGTIDNAGQRSFALEDGNIHRDANGAFKLSWKATDPKFGPIGGGAERGFVVALPAPVPPPPAPIVTPPAPAPGPLPVVPPAADALSAFDGTYEYKNRTANNRGGIETSGESIDHSETATVKGGKVSVIQVVTESSCKGSSCGFAKTTTTWSGTLELVPGPVPLANIRGQGTQEVKTTAMERQGRAPEVRSFTLQEGQVQRDAEGRFRLSWRALVPPANQIVRGDVVRVSTATGALPSPPGASPRPPSPPPVVPPTPSPVVSFDGEYADFVMGQLPADTSFAGKGTVRGTAVSAGGDFVDEAGKSLGSIRWSGQIRLRQGSNTDGILEGSGSMQFGGRSQNFVLERGTIGQRQGGRSNLLCWEARPEEMGIVRVCQSNDPVRLPGQGMPSR